MIAGSFDLSDKPVILEPSAKQNYGATGQVRESHSSAMYTNCMHPAPLLL